ncbi:MAG: tRNA pseudouridine(55) synthase TruB [Candidatus Magasanikbacteria bacterium CG_4_9_14_0_2_um_filter_41_10]|uniref:tRNA pseudouridine synthase B n=1 Tax=Candidatus Magasanikbacteria bacterium CG_4_10_14_0_2_um_filter_41_31 TaxID=1974639 RepID=A0A2M7V4H5_9BACT|nr:MAG: tRNA pseudouridine(55) synthase TruB [Candidatus Magasanikbacteria bacterium CG1_02_41_34]PIZ93459.1 MAG: tRNA pseudouridine(55) synthase TruB [Candidatus Magasanikbacteria bacterium CG_4_10_14_0_2_um_filter_41_31]PJC53688.1 MAG: tRNA pseudouridine(55) synthase TruB [Candidatus Magasanikbacteria bacterium CG_4_9_14_0_2_um_filter_41_10]
MQSGFILINKPVDWTSHDVVGYIRGIIRTSNLLEIKKPKVGHAGTLDPFATGLLIVGIGRDATKRLDEFKEKKKEYIATIRLGATSDTYDKTGTIQEANSKTQTISKSHILHVLEKFIGKQSQIPPMYSAKKVNGQKLYELARKGIEIERQPCEIDIYEIELLNMISSNEKESSDPQAIEIRISCSTGTYIRTLAHDIGQQLGTGAYCEELRRTKIGEYRVEDAHDVKDLNEKNIHSYI